jgi:hypothetical protein
MDNGPLSQQETDRRYLPVVERPEQTKEAAASQVQRQHGLVEPEASVVEKFKAREEDTIFGRGQRK